MATLAKSKAGQSRCRAICPTMRHCARAVALLFLLHSVFADVLDLTCVQVGQCSIAVLAISTATTKFLTTVPQSLSRSITLLDLTGNKISTLQGTEFVAYPLLQRM